MDNNKEADVPEDHQSIRNLNVELSLGIKELDEQIAAIIEARQNLEYMMADILSRHYPSIKINIR